MYALFLIRIQLRDLYPERLLYSGSSQKMKWLLKLQKQLTAFSYILLLLTTIIYKNELISVILKNNTNIIENKIITSEDVDG